MYIEMLIGINLIFIIAYSLFLKFSFKKQLEHLLSNENSKISENQTSEISHLREFLLKTLFKEHLENTERLSTNISKQLETSINEIRNNLMIQNNNVNNQIETLNTTIFQQLKEIRKNLDNSLANSLSKSNAAYEDIVKRLALIDAAQKRIGELSSNIVNLQDILSDNQTRGMFGEVQLATIVKNIIPPDHFKLQYTLTNGKRADCIIELPEPTGKLVIDSKFPLNSFKALNKNNLTNIEREIATKQFKKDIKKHILDIANKYIILGETSDCAIMFIPAESVFSEIHAHHADLVNISFQNKVWMASPTTMMAILNTSNAIIKDLARQKEIHLIQNHLNILSKDFHRFQNRMGNLSKHIRMANNDIDEVHASAKKIVNRFDQIEKVEIEKNEVHSHKEKISLISN
ncbi:MAG: DNA recombination protein RmuC [Legionellales bacterium]|nr:DNA recombination protein RmuC [Legionellales bacterium]